MSEISQLSHILDRIKNALNEGEIRSVMSQLKGYAKDGETYYLTFERLESEGNTTLANLFKQAHFKMEALRE